MSSCSAFRRIPSSLIDWLIGQCEEALQKALVLVARKVHSAFASDRSYVGAVVLDSQALLPVSELAQGFDQGFADAEISHGSSPDTAGHYDQGYGEESLYPPDPLRAF
jgi:hypothetical protein